MCDPITAKSWHWTMNCSKTNTIGLFCLVMNYSYLCTSGALFNISWLICAMSQCWKAGSADLGALGWPWPEAPALLWQQTLLLALLRAACMAPAVFQFCLGHGTHLPAKCRLYFLFHLSSPFFDRFCKEDSSTCLYLKDCTRNRVCLTPHFEKILFLIKNYHWISLMALCQKFSTLQVLPAVHCNHILLKNAPTTSSSQTLQNFSELFSDFALFFLSAT